MHFCSEQFRSDKCSFRSVGHRAPGEAADGPHLALPLGLRLHLRDGLSRFAARRRIGRAINVIYRLRKLYIDEIIY